MKGRKRENGGLCPAKISGVIINADISLVEAKSTGEYGARAVIYAKP